MEPHIYGQPVSMKNLRQLQLNELAILLEIDRICRKNKIEYSLDGGTLLGAVRHGGFIPWDDDADVAMSRKEYIRFRKACRKDLNKGKFFLQDHKTDSCYPWGYEKMRLLGSELTRPGQEHINCVTGVYVDIFVLDNVPDEPVYRLVHFWLSTLIRKLLYAELGMKVEKNSFKRFIYRMCYSYIPREKVFKFRDRIAAACNGRPAELVSHMTYPYPKRCKYGIPSKCLKAFKDINFEGYTFRCFEDHDAFLRAHYGEFMELPPESEQNPKLIIGELRLLPEHELVLEQM